MVNKPVGHAIVAIRMSPCVAQRLPKVFAASIAASIAASFATVPTSAPDPLTSLSITKGKLSHRFVPLAVRAVEKSGNCLLQTIRVMRRARRPRAMAAERRAAIGFH